ncbi:MAG: SGNH/GDSL hydrolase family protein [Hyphomicrobiaceae bacterium]
MRAKLGQWCQNLAVSTASLIVCFLVLELFVFRVLLLPDDVLPNVSINNVVRYMPRTDATFRHPDGRETRVRINNDGWNSMRSDYVQERTPGVKRIAVIGDSYVHGAFVNTEEGFPEILERQLQANGQRVEVLRFGMDGAPLSQYLHMLRREVRSYKPDLVVVQLIHNDFDESYRLMHNRTGSSFMKLAQSLDKRLVEIPPVDFKPGFADVLRNSATFRYLYYETNAYLTFKHLISWLYWGGSDEWKPEFVSSAVDIRNIRDHARNRMFTRYALAEMKALAEQDGFKLAFAMDGVREAIYAGKPVETYEVGKLNAMARAVAEELELPFLDLQDAFQRDWTQHRQRFEYEYDWHWNKRANMIVGKTIARFLLSEPRLLGRTAHSAAPRAMGGER